MHSSPTDALKIDDSIKPSCFGAASVFNPESERCGACAFNKDCHDLSYQKLKAMSAKFDVEDMLARFERSTSRYQDNPLLSVATITAPINTTLLETTIPTPDRTTKLKRVKVELSPADIAVVEGMPKKVQVKMRKLMQWNMDKKARQGVLTKENPFPLQGNGYLHVAFDMLVDGGFTRSTLRQSFMGILGWREGTAYSHVSAIVWLFPAMRIAIEDKGMFIPNPELRRDNES